jgi:glycosyltransferase involved in cell wall biosynthesis
LACLADEPVKDEHREALARLCRRLEVIRIDSPLRWVRAAGSLTMGRSISEGAFAAPRLRRTIGSWARDTQYSAALGSASSVAPYLRVPELRGVPAVIDLMDVDSQKWRDYAASKRGPKAWLYRLEGRRLGKLERSLLTWTRAVTFVSEAEAELFRRTCDEAGDPRRETGDRKHDTRSPLVGEGRGEGNSVYSLQPKVSSRLPTALRPPSRKLVNEIHVGSSPRGATRELVPSTIPSLQPAVSSLITAVPNGVNLDYFYPMDVPQEPACIFVGQMDYWPNVDAVTWFADEVWRAVRSACPEARFTILGRRPTEQVRRLADRPGIEVIADVPDVRSYVARSAVAIAPLRIARGIQNKVLEAMAMGKAVVASPQALEGIAATPGEHLLLANTPAAWISALLDLLNNPTRRTLFTAPARRFVEMHHNWTTCLAPLAALVGVRRKE